ncbi:MAG TPA: 4Fe-4S dicluster domain-containing protein, partial [Anaerolineaceae bacterium]|nr:4Fe-4S dicluster domain-containing protein [Anaerolineaceae bacterium]
SLMPSALWRQALNDGFRADTASPEATVTVQLDPVAMLPVPEAAGDVLEIVFEPDPTIWDGHFSNNAWLQELPKPLTKLTWDNAALLSPRTAEGLGIGENELVRISLRGRSVDAPVLIQPGTPEDTVVVSLGYGRSHGGQVQEGGGFNAYQIRASEALWFDSGVELSKTGGTYKLVTTRDHQSMENRDLIRSAPLSEYQQNPAFAKSHETDPKSLYGEWDYNSYAWGMSINLNTCIGCNACVIACQSENNIPTVGKTEVDRSREMHWLRIDRYFQGEMDRPGVAFQPVPCMHCETAPCEPVCPVEATSHSAEGINEMTYNRCVGTRYCSNNCPYKVRRFNFFKYVNDESLSLRAMRNPDVTVRSRGVMEKCTYCVQRVNQARIQAQVEGRRIADGEVKTACQQACPTNAIVFGDINDPNSAVRKLKDNPLNYSLLDELGTRPRTTYLAKVKNPNPSIQEQG